MKKHNTLGICIITIMVIVIVAAFLSAIYLIGHMEIIQNRHADCNAIEAKELGSAMTWFLGWLCFIFVVMGVLLAVFAKRFFVNPLADLSTAISEISEGNLDYEIKKNRNDEIGKLQEDLEKMRLHLKQTTEKLSTNAENARNMMSNITHDLKTPLTAIKGYSEGLLDGVAVNRDMQIKYVKTIYSKACAMEDMVEDLSYFSKLDSSSVSYNFRIIPIKEFILDCLSELEMDMQMNGIELIKDIPEGEDETIVLDPSEVRRVLMNIIGNSMKYMDKADGIIEVGLTFNEGYAWVRVRDNGRGISEKDLGHIFERFYRADQSRGTRKGGTGLGLAIAKSIIVDHGGTIKAESELGKFTEISFSLPRDAKKVKQD